MKTKLISLFMAVMLFDVVKQIHTTQLSRFS